MIDPAPPSPPRPSDLTMAEQLTPELCVIGAGTGGLAVALAAVTLGIPVVLVEKARLGADRLGAGRLPTQALIAAGRRAAALRDSGAFGVKTSKTNVEFHAVNDHVRGVLETVAPNASAARFTGLGGRLIEAEARFTGAGTVVAGDCEIKARRFVIATGSAPRLPEIAGLDQTPYLTTDQLFETRARPKQLLVVGAGPTALELAQAFQRLGSEVTVVDAGEVLPEEDEECARIVRDGLAAEGIAIRTGAAIARVRRVRNKIELTLNGEGGEETIEGSDLLIACGRRPSFNGLDLDAAGIRHTADGIVVDRMLRTSNKAVYAIGDCTGGAQFPQVAQHHAGLVVRHALLRQRVDVNADAVPRAVFTDPELAHVGVTEAQARVGKRTIRVLRWPYHDNDRAQAERRTRGHIKLVTDRNGLVLGATIVGEQASELITPFTLAINQRLDVRAFAGIVLPYPSYADIGKNAALSFFALRLTPPWWRRILGRFF